MHYIILGNAIEYVESMNPHVASFVSYFLVELMQMFIQKSFHKRYVVQTDRIFCPPAVDVLRDMGVLYCYLMGKRKMIV